MMEFLSIRMYTSSNLKLQGILNTRSIPCNVTRSIMTSPVGNKMKQTVVPLQLNSIL